MGRALNLGCGTGTGTGTGTDTNYLAAHGWDVTGVDMVPKALATLNDLAHASAP